MQQGVQTDATCNIQPCWGLLANNVASVCTGLNAEIMSSNPAKDPKFFYRVNLQLYLRLNSVDVCPIDYPSFTLLFVKLAEENEFGIVKVI